MAIDKVSRKRERTSSDTSSSLSIFAHIFMHEKRMNIEAPPDIVASQPKVSPLETDHESEREREREKEEEEQDKVRKYTK